MSDDHSNEWYYNTRTGKVEPHSGAKSADRLGPYSSPEEAARLKAAKVPEVSPTNP